MTPYSLTTNVTLLSTRNRTTESTKQNYTGIGFFFAYFGVRLFVVVYKAGERVEKVPRSATFAL
jgi:hypothetical protein